MDESVEQAEAGGTQPPGGSGGQRVEADVVVAVFELATKAFDVAGSREQMQLNAGVTQHLEDIGAQDVAHAGRHGDADEDDRRARGHVAKRRNHNSATTHCHT